MKKSTVLVLAATAAAAAAAAAGAGILSGKSIKYLVKGAPETTGTDSCALRTRAALRSCSGRRCARVRLEEL